VFQADPSCCNPLPTGCCVRGTTDVPCPILACVEDPPALDYGGQAALPGGSLYHASKWGIEGFLESLAQELAPFRIGVTIVEPGGARTDFRLGSAKLGPKMDVYSGTPAGMVRTILQDTSRLPNGDPAKMVKIMIESVDRNPAPRRLVLGSDSYAALEKALSDRLVDVRAQKELASSTDLR